VRQRKHGDVQTGEYPLKENVVFGNSAAISVISCLQEQNDDSYTFDDTETYLLGDVRFFSENGLMLVTEAEVRDPSQFNMIWYQKWEPRLSKRPGYDDHSLLIDKKIINSSEEFHSKFVHLWFDIEEARICYEKGIMPSKFIMMKYSFKVQKSLEDKFQWMSCRDKSGNSIKEWKATVPFIFLTRFEYNINLKNFTKKKYTNANNNYRPSSGISENYYG